MIARINFGLGTPAIKPRPPVGNPVGHVVAKIIPVPKKHSLVVKNPL
jgi:hypothetical protein